MNHCTSEPEDVLYAPASPEPNTTQGTTTETFTQLVSMSTENEITEVPIVQEATEASTQAVSTANVQEITTKPTTPGMNKTFTQAITMPTIQEITEMPTSQKITRMPTTSDLFVVPTTFPAENETSCKILTALSTFSESSNLFECVATEKELCDRVDCTAELSRRNYTAEITLLPCYNPPAIEISIRQGVKLLSSNVVSQSQEMVIPELFDLMLNVTLDHFPNAIGLQV